MNIRTYLGLVGIWLIMAITLAACGSDPGTPGLPPAPEGGGETGEDATGQETADDATGEETGEDATGQETADDATGEEDAGGTEGPEEDCFKADDCSDFPTTACENAICNEDGLCEAIPSAVLDCCVEDADCDDDLDATVDSCPTPGESCVYQEPVGCSQDADCSDFAAVNACQEAVCDLEINECVAAPNSVPDCCLGPTDPCDDGKDYTLDSCPEAGASCEHELLQIPCTDVSDCSETIEVGLCEKAFCAVTGFCETENTQGNLCCLSAADCNDGNGATIDSCPSPGEACQTILDPTACAGTDVVFLDTDFDSGNAQGWTIAGDKPDQVVNWHLSNNRSDSGYFSYYFGRTECPTYYSGLLDANCGILGEETSSGGTTSATLVSPDVNLAPALEGNPALVVLMSMKVWVEMEWIWPDGVVPDGDVHAAEHALEEDTLDNLIVDVVWWEEQGGNGVTMRERIWWAVDVEKDTGGAWLHLGADLSQYAGKEVFRIEITGRADSVSNFYEGAYIDSILVKTGCDESIQCGNGTSCSTVNPCVSSECTPLVNTGGGACMNLKDPLCTACLSGQDFECNDDDSCSLESCVDNVCTYEGALECCDDEVLNGPFAFDEGTLPEGWSVTGGKGGIGWSVAQIDPLEGDYHLYFGNPLTGDFVLETKSCAFGPNAGAACEDDDDCGGFPVCDPDGVVGSVTTNVMQLPDYGGLILGSFDLLLATEWVGDDPNNYVGTPFFGNDRFTVEVLSAVDGAETATLVFDSYDLGGSTAISEEQFAYEPVNMDLTSFSGEAVRLRLTFDSGDGFANAFGGVLVENLGIHSVCTESVDCMLSPECEDNNACTVSDFCVLGSCSNIKEDPLCCETVEDCDDDNPCTNETCNAGVCEIELVSEDCCFPASDSIEDFDGSDAGWLAENFNDTVGWSFVEDADAAFDGDGFLHFGNYEEGSYSECDEVCLGQPGGSLESCCDVATGQIESPSFALGTQGVNVLRFMLNLSTEWDQGGFQPLGFPIDQLTVLVKTEAGIGVEVWNSELIAGSTQGQWELVEIGLKGYEGENVSFIFQFDSGDVGGNDFGGPMIDALQLDTDCDEVDCFTALECTASVDPCQYPVCVANLCGFDQVDSPECCLESVKSDEDFEGGPEGANGFTYGRFLCEDPSDPGQTDINYPANFLVGNNCTDCYDPSQGNCVEDGTAAVGWQVSDIDANSGTFSLYFGDPATESYQDGANGVSGFATSPLYQTFSGKTSSLSAQVYVDVEQAGASPFAADRFEILAVTEDGTHHLVWTKSELDLTDYGKWVEINVDLSAVSGSPFQLKFYFDSIDELANESKGIFVDDIQIVQECSDI